jgi:hypothetical protein
MDIYPLVTFINEYIKAKFKDVISKFLEEIYPKPQLGK